VQKGNTSIVIIRKRKNVKSENFIFINEKFTENPFLKNHQNLESILSFCLGKTDPIELKFLRYTILCTPNNILKNQPNLRCDSIVDVL